MADLKREYTIVIVTHNMQQAARVSDMTAFMTTDVDEDASRVGRLVEYDATDEDLHQPVRPAHRGLHHRSVRMSAAATTGRPADRRVNVRSSHGTTRRRSHVQRRRDAVISVDAAGARPLRRGRRRHRGWWPRDGDERRSRNRRGRAVPRRPPRAT